MEIEKVMIPIEKIINNSEECFAHVAKDNKQKETLKEHTERCQKYWKNLVEKKNLTEILEEFEKCYFNSTDEKVKEIFESMTVNIVTMHDIGKVNPEFQKEKMDHLWHRDVPLNDKVGSKHSIISSVFYLDYYIGIINLAVKNETIYKSDGEKLKDFAYIYSYIISRHHGDLTELPNLEVLTNNKMETVRLIEHREKYFNHKKFAKRVQADYSLLGYKITKEELQEHVLAQAQDGKKILIEFIKKKSAEEFYRNIREKSPIPVLLMTGDSCILDRKRIIRQTKEMKSVILIATQVIEAGVDIDMDIGYKDISRLDSEEQFMGRINRSGKKEGVVYFFNMDDASVIYKNDVRIEKDKTLENEEIRQLLLLKNFPEFYETRILPSIKKEGEKINDKNLEEFFCDKVALLNMPEVAKRMRLIDDNRQMISVYLGRILQNEKGEKIDGRVLWQEYKGLIEECKLEYAEKKIKLHDIRSQMNGFIYQFSNQIKLQEDEQIGDIFFIENGERYFDENGVLMKELFEDNTDLFI